MSKYVRCFAKGMRVIPVHRPAWLAGAIAVAGFILVSTIESFSRQDYSLARHWISHLALGERGIIGTMTITASGLLYLWFGAGLRGQCVWGSRLVMLAGGTLVVAGLSPIDPGLNYPPGVVATHSTSGTVHDVAALVLIVALVCAAVVIGRATDRVAAGTLIAVLVAAAFITCSVLVALDHAGMWPKAPGGLLERLALFGGMAWPVIATAREQKPGSSAALTGRSLIPR